MTTVTDYPPPCRTICRFWPRIAAFLIDGAVLTGIGLILGFFLFARLAALGQSGRWIGFLVSVTYAGTLNSVFGRGQTIGKRALGIRVVGKTGELISLPRSLMREAVLVTPFLANGVVIPAWMMDHPLGRAIGYSWAYIPGLLGMAIVYLYLFNRRSRQSAHDLLFGTYVTEATSAGPVAARPVWPGHWWIMAGIVAAIILAGWGMMQLIHVDAFAGMSKAIERIEASNRFDSATANIATSTVISNGTRHTESIYSVTVAMKVRPEDYERAARDIAQIVLAADPGAQSCSKLSVNIRYGYDIGIARASFTRGFSHTPAQWSHL